MVGEVPFVSSQQRIPVRNSSQGGEEVAIMLLDKLDLFFIFKMRSNAEVSPEN